MFGENLKAPLGTGNPADVLATRNVVKAGTTLYAQVSLENLLTELLHQFDGHKATPKTLPDPWKPAATIPKADQPITYDTFFACLNGYLTPDNLVVAEIGLSTFGGSSYLSINRQNGFLSQAIWASIGWSVPAGLGASFTPGVRPIVIVGDGAFKLTCQELSTMVSCGCNTVVFVLNNRVYAVEQMLLDAKPFVAGSSADFEAANVLQPWDYISLMKGFSNNDPQAMSANVNTVGDMQAVLSPDQRTFRGRVVGEHQPRQARLSRQLAAFRNQSCQILTTPKPNLAMTKHIDHTCDVLIVGAGVSGLFAASRLLEHDPNQTILIVDKLNRTGGRLQTTTVAVCGTDGAYYDVRNEEGGMRFCPEGTGMPNLWKLINTLDLMPVPFPMGGPENRYFFRGQSFTRAQTPAIWAKIFSLAPSEQGKDPGTIFGKVMTDILTLDENKDRAPRQKRRLVPIDARRVDSVSEYVYLSRYRH